MRFAARLQKFHANYNYGWVLARGVRLLSTLVVLSVGLAGCSKPGSTDSTSQILRSAWSDFTLSEFSGAGQKFSEVARRPSALDAERLEAEYGLASIAALGADADLAKATQLYDHVIQTAPRSDLAGWSQLAIVRMQQQSIGTATPEARNTIAEQYAKVIEGYPNQAPADEAFVHLQALRLIPLDENSARQVIADITAYLVRPTHYAAALYSLRSTAHRLCGEYQAAYDDQRAAIDHREKYPNVTNVIDAGMLYSMGVSAQFDLGDFTSARRYYHQFLDLYPTEQRSFTVKLLMKNMDKVEATLSKPGAAISQLEVP